MGMTVSSSGKRGYKLYYGPSDVHIPRDDMIKILKSEDHYRFCHEYQDKYTACGDDLDQIKAVTKELQLRALSDHGYSGESALIRLNNMRQDFEGDDEVRNLAVYHRTDVCFDWRGLRRGSLAPNAKIYDLKGQSTTVHELMINSVARINEYARQFADSVYFAAVYIAEAHASDVWPLGSTVCIRNHTTLEERINIAQTELVEKRGCEIPVFVDTMENDFNTHYDAWPERFYILENKPLTPNETDPKIEIAEIALPSEQDQGFDRTIIESDLKHRLAMAKAELRPFEGSNPA